MMRDILNPYTHTCKRCGQMFTLQPVLIANTRLALESWPCGAGEQDEATIFGHELEQIVQPASPRPGFGLVKAGRTAVREEQAARGQS